MGITDLSRGERKEKNKLQNYPDFQKKVPSSLEKKTCANDQFSTSSVWIWQINNTDSKCFRNSEKEYWQTTSKVMIVPWFPCRMKLGATVWWKYRWGTWVASKRYTLKLHLSFPTFKNNLTRVLKMEKEA